MESAAPFYHGETPKENKKKATFTAEIIPSNYLQTVDYRYNIRGQLLYINNSKLTNDGGITNNDTNDLFGMQMQYDQSDGKLSNGGGNNQRWDGKLTAVKWMSKDGSGNPTVERSYCYNYDQLNRYVSAAYAERPQASTGNFSNNLDGFDESNISYDAGGNLLTLNRFTSTPGALISPNQKIDSLTYRYDPNNPNQLHTVVDGTSANFTGFGFRNLTGGAGNYVYDPNGNLVTDPYKGLTLTYDVLNRTDKITVTTATNRYINYTYDGGGNLIRKQAYDNNVLQTTTDYVDGFVYLNGTLSYFPMPEGRVLNNGGTFKQEFIITDQQGNARVSFQDNGSGTAVVKQENSYYGFGLIMPNSPVAMPATPNKQLYNGGSEWQNDYSNLPDYYQTFNRNYDAAIGRFIGVDPDAEGAESLSTYQYAGNNPVMNNDPLGNKICGNCQVVDYSTFSGGGIPSNNWMNEGAFDDEGDGGANPYGLSFSSDGGAGGRQFWLGAEQSGGALDANSGNIVNISSVSVIADMLNSLKAGNNVTVNLSGGSYAITFNNAQVNVADPSDNAGTAGIIAYGQANSGNWEALTGGGIGGANQGGDTPGWRVPIFAANTITIAPYYPPNDGFEGAPTIGKSSVGDILLRRGGTSGRFYTRPGTAPEETSVPPGTNTAIEQFYRVIKEFDQAVGAAAAWFGQIGGGTQIKTEMTTEQLLNGEFIEPIEPIDPLIIP